MKQVETWMPFNGRYEKKLYDVMLHDGTIIRGCWPNAGSFHVLAIEITPYTRTSAHPLINAKNVSHIKYSYEERPR